MSLPWSLNRSNLLSFRRHHAVIQHAYDGSLWLYDLASSCGSKLNGQVIETQNFHRLVDGTTMQFGHSPRQYTVKSGVVKGSSDHLDSFEKLAARSASRHTKLKNHFSDLQAALKSAAGVVKSQAN